MINNINTLRQQNHRGQTLLETILIFPVLMFVMSFTLIFLYMTYARSILKTELHESLVCNITEKNSSFCEQRSKENIERFLFAGSLTSLALESTSSLTKGVLEWQLFARTYPGTQLKIEQTLPWKN